jgi:hypothetical protein
MRSKRLPWIHASAFWFAAVAVSRRSSLHPETLAHHRRISASPANRESRLRLRGPCGA